MRRIPGRSRTKTSHARTAIRGAAILLSICALTRLLAALGADLAAEGLIYDIVSRDGVAENIMRFELGVPAGRGAGREAADMPAPYGEGGSGAPAEEEQPYVLEPYIDRPDPSAPVAPPDADAPRFSDAARLEPESVAVNNTTEYEIDVSALMSEISALPSEREAPVVLILHTHGSEAYTPDGNDAYEPSEPYRTEDSRYNVVRVGDELEKRLTERGFSVIHDTGIYDFPSYQGSYGRTDAVVASYLESRPDINLIIDLHRDAISAPDGSQYKTVANVGDGVCSQIMFFVGTDSAGLHHPGWRDNLKLALRIQNEMNARYPSLARPIYLSQYRYNQHRSPGSLLVEVGSAGNTLRESLDAVRYFADAYANAVLSQGFDTEKR
ncbi:MAG: stage II sporulation protein P [Oscillospiraceae bacterium]|nr:stage II sporulation protein P [Oscillospiraceae bacterium]